MSDHISKTSQAKAGHTDTAGIKLKPVTGATKLILEGAKAAVADTNGHDKVRDTDREMDLTFYDVNGNVETADPDGDISMDDDTTMQSIENDDDTSSSIDEPVSADTSITFGSDGAADFDSDGVMQSTKQFAFAEDAFSSDDDDEMTNSTGGLIPNGNEDDTSGEADGEVQEPVTDDELEPSEGIDGDLAWEEVEKESLQVVNGTRTLYDVRNALLRQRKFVQLKASKEKIKQQLSLLGVSTLRLEDVAWDNVVLYNEEIRELWIHCNQNDPFEKDRVMRQIDDLMHKRQQELAQVNQPDCPIKFWELAAGWVQPEYRKALPPLEPEPVQRPEATQQPESSEQTELVATQAPFTDVASLDRDNGNSDPEYGVPGTDLDHMDSFQLGVESHFDTAFEDTASSQRYEAGLPDLAAFESLWTAPTDDTTSTQLDGTELAQLQDQVQTPVPIEQVSNTQSQSEHGDSNDDNISLFSDTDDDQVDPALVSCQAAEEPQIPENASHVSPITHQALTEDQVLENNGWASFFSDRDEDSQPESAEVTDQAVEEPLLPENDTIADTPLAKQQVSQEQHAVEGHNDDDASFDNELEHELERELEQIGFETAPSSDQNTDKPQSSVNTANDMCDARDSVHSAPVAQADQSPEAQLNPGSEALPTQESGAPFDQGLEVEPQVAEQPAPENQAVPGAAPVEQVALAPQEGQPTADQSEANGEEGTEAPSMPPDPAVREIWNPYSHLPLYYKCRPGIAHLLETMHERARSQLRPFWRDGKQVCSDMQLELFASGSKEFMKLELERYQVCSQNRQDYIVEFWEDFEEAPPNKLLTAIDNGRYLFYCMVDQVFGQDDSHNESADIVDITGDDSTSSATAASLGVQEAVLAAPAEIVAAGQLVSATAGRASDANGPATLEDETKATKRVPNIPTPPPVDEAAFAQGAVSIPNNAEPTTPLQNGANEDNGPWSSDWSGKAFTDGGKSPRMPSNQEIDDMEHSVTSDKSIRETMTPDEATGQAERSKKGRDKAPTSTASGSLSSVHNAHNALNHQLSQTGQAAGNGHAAPTAPGLVAGPSNAAQPVQQQSASQGTTGKRHVGRPHKDDSELTSPRKRRLKHPDSPCAEPSEGGNKRRKKNAPAAADTTDAYQGQQHGTPQESRPAQYYGPSPDRSLDAKEWVEEHTQGGKGKKRKAPAPKKTPPPRKVRKTKEATPTAPAPRNYRAIAPAPSQNQNDANGVQMQSRASTPMGHSSATGPSPNVQMNGNGTQMHSAAPHMQSGRSQQISQQSSQQLPQQQSFQYPAGQQNGFANPVQQQNFQHSVGQQNGSTDPGQQQQDWEEELGPDELKRKLAELTAQCQQLQSIVGQQGRQQVQQHPNMPAQVMPNQPTQQVFQQQPAQQGFYQQPMQQGFSQLQSYGMTSSGANTDQFQQGVSLGMRLLAAQMSQPPMAMPRMMSNQGMPSNGVVPFPANMQESHRPASGTFPQDGNMAPMNLNQGSPWTNVQGMSGGFVEGVDGAYMGQEGMQDFSGFEYQHGAGAYFE